MIWSLFSGSVILTIAAFFSEHSTMPIVLFSCSARCVRSQ
jgi:hypothetical protein